MSLIVTATQGGSVANGMALRVYVLNNAAAVQSGGTSNNQFAAATSFTQSVTTTQAGSRVYGVSAVFANNSATAAAATTLVDNIADAVNNARYVTFKAAALTGTPGPTTLGFTVASSAGPFAQAEILPATGTLTEDNSAPAVVSVTGAEVAATAAFSPPSGSLLVALVASHGGVGTETMTVSGGGLKWTELVKNDPAGGDYAGVWIAQVPSPASWTRASGRMMWSPGGPAQTFPLSITTTSLPAGTDGVPYSATVVATGGLPAYTWTVSVGNLPAWASLNSSTGAITGTPSGAPATTNFTIEVTDSNLNTASQAFSITTTAPLVIITPSALVRAKLPVSFNRSGTAGSEIATSSGAYPATGNISGPVVRGTGQGSSGALVANPLTVTPVGTPVAATGTTSPVTGVWGYGQEYARQVGDLLIAVVTFTSTTSVTATAENAGTTGWTKLVEELSTPTSTLAVTAIWYKVAAGNDAAPAFTSTLGTTNTSSCTLYVLRSAAVPDAIGVVAATAASVSAQTVTTAGIIHSLGEYAIAGFCRERASASPAVTMTAPFVLDTSNTGVASTGHFGAAHLLNPPAGHPLSATINYSSTATTSAAAGVIVTFFPQGVGPPFVPKNYAVRASLPRDGNPYTLGRPGLTCSYGTSAANAGTWTSGTGRVMWSPGGPVQNPVPPPVVTAVPQQGPVKAKAQPRPGLVYAKTAQQRATAAVAWSVLQSASNNVPNIGNSVAVTYGTNLSSGSTLIAAVSSAADGSTLPTTISVKDGAGNSFVQIVVVNGNTSTGANVSLWALNTPAGDVGTKPTITATATGTNGGYSILVQEVSGLATGTTAAQFADGTAGTSFAIGSGSVGPPTYASGAANEYLVYIYGDSGEGVTYTAPTGAGYTADANGVNGSGNADLEISYKNSTGGTESGQYSLSGNADWQLILVAFKLVGGAPVGTATGVSSYSTGRVGASYGAPVQNPGPGPVFTQRTSPVRVHAQLPVRGRIGSNPGSVKAVIPPAPAIVRHYGPVRAQQPLPRRGTCRAILFVPLIQPNPQPGPVFVQAAGPVRARIPQNAPRGRINNSKGVRGVIPAVTPFFPQGLVRAKLPQQPFLKGRISSNPGAPLKNPQPGPVFRQPVQVLRARTPLPARGRIGSNPGVVVPPAVIVPFRSATTPARIRPSLPLRGHIYFNSGAPVRNPQPGPEFTQATSPIRARIPQVYSKGRIGSNPGTVVPPPLVAGPPFYPIRFPARARIPQNAPRGRVYSNKGAPVHNPQPGPFFRQATAPVQARHPLPPRGRISSNPGVLQPVVIGPVFRQATEPIRARIPQTWSKGRISSNPGTSPQPLPVWIPWHGPVRIHPVLPPRGRIWSNQGTPVFPPGIGPRVYAQKGPARVHPVLPPRGRIASNKGAPVRNPQPGPVFRQAVRPIRGIIPQNAPRGRIGSNPGGPVENIPNITLIFRYGDPEFGWTFGAPEFEWAYNNPEFQWVLGPAEL